MSVVVPTRAPLQFMAAARVARPVSQPCGEAYTGVMHFLHGRCKSIVGSVSGLARTNGDVRLSYRHEAGARALLVHVSLNDGTDATARAIVDVQLNGSSSALGGTTSFLNNSSVLACPTSRSRVTQVYEKYFDVSGLTVGTVYDLLVSPSTSAGTPQGVYSVAAYVVPRDSMDPENNPSTDQGTAFYFCRGWNPIFAGSASTAADTGGGTERLVYEMDRRRKYATTYPLQLATIENDTYAFQTTSAAFANLTNLDSVSFRCMATRLYTTATGGTYQARIRYKSAGGNGTIRFATTPVGGAATNYDITLTTSAAYAWATGAVTLGTGGTNQEVDIAIQAKVAGGGTLYIDSIALYSNES